MKIRKAVLTAAAPTQRDLPFQTLVDRDGNRKSVLALLVDEMRAAGAEEVAVVVHPGDSERLRALVDDGVRFLIQDAPRGYGHAVWCAREFVGDQPFLHQVGDHVFVDDGPAPHARLLVDAAGDADCAVSGVQPTRESQLPLFGAVGASRVRGTHDRYQIQTVREKPTPTEAEQSLLVPGLRAGTYLCFIGTHVLTPTVFELLDEAVAGGADRVQLSPALDALARRELYLAVETPGRRYPLDARYGLLMAQLAVGLSGAYRDEVLTGLCDLLAQREAGA